MKTEGKCLKHVSGATVNYKSHLVDLLEWTLLEGMSSHLLIYPQSKHISIQSFSLSLKQKTLTNNY